MGREKKGPMSSQSRQRYKGEAEFGNLGLTQTLEHT